MLVLLRDDSHGQIDPGTEPLLHAAADVGDVGVAEAVGGHDFDEFLEHSIPRQNNYSWEVEQDAMVWENAIGGIATVERKLRALREGGGERSS